MGIASCLNDQVRPSALHETKECRNVTEEFASIVGTGYVGYSAMGSYSLRPM